MTEWAFVAILVAVGVALVVFLLWMPTWLRRHPEQRGAGPGSGLAGGMDQLYNPGAGAERAALDEQQRLVQPAPAPSGGSDDGDPLADGRIRIDLDRP